MSYLTEIKLGNFLHSIYSELEIIHNKSYRDYKFRPDFYIKEKNLVIEFDGYQHYTKSAITLSDLNKDTILSDDGIKVVRIPYFVQLSTTSIKHLIRI